MSKVLSFYAASDAHLQACLSDAWESELDMGNQREDLTDLIKQKTLTDAQQARVILALKRSGYNGYVLDDDEVLGLHVTEERPESEPEVEPTKERADVKQAIAYLKSIGIAVYPEPVENAPNRIAFKCKKSNRDVFRALDRNMSKENADLAGYGEVIPFTPGQAWNNKFNKNLDGVWYDNRHPNFTDVWHCIEIKSISVTECVVILTEELP